MQLLMRRRNSTVRRRGRRRPTCTTSFPRRHARHRALIVQGDKDDLVSEPAVAKLAEKISKQRGLAIDYRVVPGANHFFQEQQEIVSSHGHRLSGQGDGAPCRGGGVGLPNPSPLMGRLGWG